MVRNTVWLSLTDKHACMVYLCGLGQSILRAFGNGAKISAVYHSHPGQRGNNQEHEARQAGGDVELQE